MSGLLEGLVDSINALSVKMDTLIQRLDLLDNKVDKLQVQKPDGIANANGREDQSVDEYRGKSGSINTKVNKLQAQHLDEIANAHGREEQSVDEYRSESESITSKVIKLKIQQPDEITNAHEHKGQSMDVHRSVNENINNKIRQLQARQPSSFRNEPERRSMDTSRSEGEITDEDCGGVLVRNPVRSATGESSPVYTESGESEPESNAPIRNGQKSFDGSFYSSFRSENYSFKAPTTQKAPLPSILKPSAGHVEKENAKPSLVKKENTKSEPKIVFERKCKLYQFAGQMASSRGVGALRIVFNPQTKEYRGVMLNEGPKTSAEFVISRGKTVTDKEGQSNCGVFRCLEINGSSSEQVFVARFRSQLDYLDFKDVFNKIGSGEYDAETLA